MKLIVNNLGAVRHAEVDLSKDLLLFTGANNTGKTYLAYIIDALMMWSNTYHDGFSYDINNINGSSHDYTYDLRKGILEVETSLGRYCSDNLSLVFATNQEHWHQTEFEIKFTKEDYDVLLNSKIDIHGSNLSDGSPGSFKKSSGSYILTSENLEPEHLDQIFMELFFRKRTTIFTSERSGINVFSKELSITKSRLLSSILQKSTSKELFDLVSDRVDRYPLPVRHSLANAETYDTKKKKNSDFAHLANELEAQFLSGKVSVTEGGDLQFSPDGNGKILEIHTTSSTVKSLSPIVFYLRHQAQKGDFIIIDEPELNLHPDNQRKIARFFGRLINEGFKVLISTHSDYIVRELNNLIMLGSGLQTKPEETRALMKTYGYAENELLKKEQIAPYLFRVGKDVAEIPVTEIGFSVETIDEEAQKMNQSSQNIYFTLFDE